MDGRVVRQPRRLPDSLESAEVAAFIGDLDTHRDRAIALAMVPGGLRAAEVRGLRLADVNMGLLQVRVAGKGNREPGELPLASDTPAGIADRALLTDRTRQTTFTASSCLGCAPALVLLPSLRAVVAPASPPWPASLRVPSRPRSPRLRLRARPWDVALLPARAPATAAVALQVLQRLRPLPWAPWPREA
jgi:hypothetical protein